MELLVVMAIIILLLAATLPALRGPMGVNSRRGAVNTLLGTLDQARALAISEGRTTYVVFGAVPPDTATPSNQFTTRAKGKLSADTYGRGYAIFADLDNVNFTKTMRSAWQYLPTGVCFKVDDASGSALSATNQPSDGVTFPVPSSRGGSGGDLDLPYWKFDPTGAASLSGAISSTTAANSLALYRRVLLFEGYLDPASGRELSTKRVVGNDPRVGWEEICLNYATGRVRYTPDPKDISPTPTP